MNSILTSHSVRRMRVLLRRTSNAARTLLHRVARILTISTGKSNDRIVGTQRRQANHKLTTTQETGRDSNLPKFSKRIRVISGKALINVTLTRLGVLMIGTRIIVLRNTNDRLRVHDTQLILSVQHNQRRLIRALGTNSDLLVHFNQVSRHLGQHTRRQGVRYGNHRVSHLRLSLNSRPTTRRRRSRVRRAQRRTVHHNVSTRNIVRILLKQGVTVIKNTRLRTFNLLVNGTLSRTRTHRQVLRLYVSTTSLFTIITGSLTRTRILPGRSSHGHHHRRNRNGHRRQNSNGRSRGQTSSLSTTSSSPLKRIIHHLTSVRRIISRTTRRITQTITIRMHGTGTLVLIGRILTRLKLRTHTRRIAPVTRGMTTDTTSNVRRRRTRHSRTRHLRGNDLALDGRPANRVTRSGKRHRIGNNGRRDAGDVDGGGPRLKLMVQGGPLGRTILKSGAVAWSPKTGGR